MITFLSRRFIKNPEQVQDASVRRSYGYLCGGVGIFLNLLLCIGKLIAGALSGSIAITADAMNNLSDAGSSMVTLLGFKLAGQKPDMDHPYGHGRMEYISGLIVAMLILLMGFELGKSSIEKILQPEAVEFSWLSAGVLACAIVVKLYMASYNRSIGKKIQSAAMLATAADSLSDSAATGAVLLCSLLGHWLQWNIDGWAGVFVAALILRAGYGAAKDTISPLLGQAPDPALVGEIETLVLSFPDICGVHDLLVHDYGPGRLMISLHAEVPANGDLLALHDTIDCAEQALRDNFACQAVIHMDPIDTDDALVCNTRLQMEQLVKQLDSRATVHDLRMVTGPTHTNVIFDVACPFDVPLTNEQIQAKMRELVRQLNGNYCAVVTVDRVSAMPAESQKS